jgi:hypothetical protein
MKDATIIIFLIGAWITMAFVAYSQDCNNNKIDARLKKLEAIEHPVMLKPNYYGGRLAVNPQPNYEKRGSHWPKKRALATIP